MKAKILSLALMSAMLTAPLASVLAAAEPATRAGATVNAPDPAVQIMDMARQFQANDIAGLARSAIPASHWEEVKLVYELKRLEPIDEDDRREFAENVGRFTAPDAVDALMTEIEPKLVEARAQWPGAQLMAFGAMHMAANSSESELSDEQRAALRQAIPGLQQWIGSTDFLSSATLRQALTLLTDAARRTGITDLDQLKAMPLESVLAKAGPVLAAGKDAVRLYGIDLDAVLDTLQVDVLERGADSARIRATVQVFGAPLASEHELVLVEGRWYGKDAALHWSTRHSAQVD